MDKVWDFFFRNSLDDAEVLKQELVTVQKMMDEVSLQKEEEIQNLKQEITDMNKMAHEREQADRKSVV